MAKYSEGEEVCYNGKDFARILISGVGGDTYVLEEEMRIGSPRTIYAPEVELHELTYAQRLTRIEEALGLD